MSDNFSKALSRIEKAKNPIYAAPSNFSLSFLLFLRPESFMLLLFKKKRINGINKCPILGIDIYCGVELFNAIYFFVPRESSSTQHFRRSEKRKDILCVLCMGR